MQPRPCDDRFHTPRVSASSSRSQNSNAYRVAAARDTITSARSTSSSDSEFNRTSMSFTDRSSRPAPSLAPSQYISDYTVPNQSAASFRTAAAAANMHQENDLQKIVPDLTIFSLARHGRAGEVEALLQRGFPADARDEYGNTLLMVACQVRDATFNFPLFFRFPPYPVFSFPHMRTTTYSIPRMETKKLQSLHLSMGAT